MDNLEAELGVVRCREILSSGPHAEPKEQFLPEKKKFLKSKGIDDYLRKKHEEYVEELKKHMKEKTLYFTQEITKEVLDYVRETPTCQVGVRGGDIIYVTKIPYMAKKYLLEKDPKKKRYYACHCARAKHGFGIWAVTDKEEKTLLGRCGLNMITDTSETEVDFVLAKDYWGKGYATEAAKVAIGYGFVVLKIDRIIALAKPEHTASRRVIEKLGMHYVREAIYWNITCAYYDLTKADYDQHYK